MSDKNKKSFWPYGILLSILAIIAACIVTVYVSLDYPVHIDDFYFDKYQNVENNYNEIQIKQANFEKNVKIDLKNVAVYIDGNLAVNGHFHQKNLSAAREIIVNKNVSLVFDVNSSLKAEVVLTRPQTGEFDRNLTYDVSKNGKFIINNFSVNQTGRWIIKMKLYDSFGGVGFYQLEIFSR